MKRPCKQCGRKFERSDKNRYTNLCLRCRNKSYSKAKDGNWRKSRDDSKLATNTISRIRYDARQLNKGKGKK